jgi:hypothetical protein
MSSSYIEEIQCLWKMQILLYLIVALKSRTKQTGGMVLQTREKKKSPVEN